MLDAALRSLRRNRCLDLWAGQVDVNVIADTLAQEFGEPFTQYSVRGIVARAREEGGDERAAPHIRRHEKVENIDADACIDKEIARLQEIAETNLKDPAQLENDILDLWADGIEGAEIAQRVGTYKTKVADVVSAARRRGDHRAVQRKVKAPEVEVEKPNSLGVQVDTVEVAVADAILPWQRKPVSVRKVSIDPSIALRNIKTSIEREQGRQISLTASLMGDPPPERSALGREVRPEEYASKEGQGRWRDPFLGRGATSVAVRKRQGGGDAKALAYDRMYESGYAFGERKTPLIMRCPKKLLHSPQNEGR